MSRKLRFTDCGKWEDPWYMELPSEMKLLWLFVCDKSDNAGVWKVNQRLTDMILGTRIDWQLAINVFDGRVQVLPGGEKWYLSKFVAFQYPGGLSVESAPHRQVVALLREHGIDPSPFLKENLPSRVVGRLPSSHKDKDKDSPSSVCRGDARGEPSTAAPCHDRDTFVDSLDSQRLDTHESAVKEWIGFTKKLGITDWPTATDCVRWVVDKARGNDIQVRFRKHIPDGYGDDWKWSHEKRPTERIA